jgi:glutaredoxin-dependent peroxiredoxin
MPLKTGDQAPEFTLLDSDKNKVSLSSHKGKNVVLLFFPAAFTSTCTKELCQTRDELSLYNDLNASVYGISVDLPFTLARYKQDQHYNFPLLSDFNKTASADYGALYDEWILGLKGVSKRASFVIDKEGVIRYAEVLENASDYPDFDKIKETLKKLN